MLPGAAVLALAVVLPCLGITGEADRWLAELLRDLPTAAWSEPVFPRGDSHAPELAAVETWAREGLGYEVVYARRPPGAVLDRPVRRITISRGLSPNGRLQALAHELGHILEPAALTASNDQPAVDAFAEAVAYLVTRALGVRSYFSKAYLRRLPPTAWRVLAERRHAILAAAGRILMAVDGVGCC